MKRTAGAVLLVLLLAGCANPKPVRPVALGEAPKNARPIVLTDGKQLFTVQADGSDRHALTKPDRTATPAWSPDGDRVAFISGEERHLAVVRAGGGRPAALQTEEDQPIESASGPISWNPDGDSLALNLFEDPTSGSVYYYDLKTRQSTVFWTKQYDNTWESDPSFSPDGNQIVFVWNERTDGDYRNGPQDLWRIDTTGKNLTKLYAASSGFVHRPDWGRWVIVLELRQPGGWANTDSRYSSIHVIMPDGKGDRVLVDNAQWPRLAPDGRRVAFIRDHRLWAVGIDGRSARRIKSVSRVEALDW